MCGIFGYMGDGVALEKIVAGLKRMEYRGYDSWGVALKNDGEIYLRKEIGEIQNGIVTSDFHDSQIGIGHTRWATHGGVNQLNAHPHLSTDGSFALAQNGIVENYQDIKEFLKQQGYVFISETDTEVIVRLIEHKLKTSKDFTEALRAAFLELKGRNTVVALERDIDRITAIRNGSPLVVGIGTNECMLASDTLAFSNITDQVIYVENNQLVELFNREVRIYDVKTFKSINYTVERLDAKSEEISKDGYAHFMLKEIVEQKHTIQEATSYSESELQDFIAKLRTVSSVYLVGAGTAAFAAAQIAYFFRKVAGIKAIEIKSYEMESYKNIFTSEDLLLAVSQSGETADTIEAIEIAKSKGVSIASIVNMVGSTIVRMSDFSFLSRSGPEICVASTKAFTAQISWGFLVAMTIIGRHDEAKAQLSSLSDTLSKYFSEETFEKIRSIAGSIKNKEHFFILGRGSNYIPALEGALKVKEITYKHFEGFAAGELKHGVIALVENGTPVFCIVTNDESYDDMISAASEVKARGARTVGIGSSESDIFDEHIFLPDCGALNAIVSIIPFQLLSYFLGVELNNNIDKPRNLAKSVTVK